MSLMNDALRKKRRDQSADSPGTRFSTPLRRSGGSKKWMLLPVAAVLLTIAAIYGIRWMRSATGNTTPVLKNASRPIAYPSEPSSVEMASTETGNSVLPLKPVAVSGTHNANNHSTGPTNASPSPLSKDLLMDPPKAATVHGNAPPPAIGPPARTAEPDQVGPVVMEADSRSVSHKAPTREPREAPGEESHAVSPRFEPDPEKNPDQRHEQPYAAALPPAIVKSLTPDPVFSPVTESVAIRKAPTGEEAGRTGVQSADGETLFYKKARMYHHSGRLADAVRLYRQVLTMNAGHRGALQNLSGAYIQMGRYGEAKRMLDQLSQMQPRPAGVLLNLAIAAIGMGDATAALDILARAEAESDAAPWEIHFHRAVALARMDRFEEALPLYRQAEKARPGDPRIQFNLALTHDALGRYRQALAHYHNFLEHTPDKSDPDKKTVIRRIETIRRYLDAAPTANKDQS
ncbi:MAG: hypothetical protein CR984_02585 [Proteobacteria bacterium]|nr:MAG: hypothetical protein CR984_02585 [Pseudomonadota bacterium]PIE67764.1 MAG: hypothetical protein CSA23_02345 [Deltaproteobacteria bacterium]